jgi:NAD(P) transhydrogenase subunit beta
VLIVIGVLIGTLLGVPSARQVKMTAIPRMVASASAVVVLSRS